MPSEDLKERNIANRKKRKAVAKKQLHQTQAEISAKTTKKELSLPKDSKRRSRNFYRDLMVMLLSVLIASGAFILIGRFVKATTPDFYGHVLFLIVDLVLAGTIYLFSYILLKIAFKKFNRRRR